MPQTYRDFQALEDATPPFQGVFALARRLLPASEFVVSLLETEEALDWFSDHDRPVRSSRSGSIAERVSALGADEVLTTSSHGAFTHGAGDYVGVAISNAHGQGLGGFGMLNPARALTSEDLAVLREVAGAARDVISAAGAGYDPKYLEALNLAGVGYWNFNIATQAIRWTDTTFRLCGCDPKDGTPSIERFKSLFSQEDRAAMQAAIRGLIQNGGQADYRLRLNRSDGEQRHLMVHAKAVSGPDKAVTSIFGVVMDTTDLQQQIIQARRDEHRYRLLADNIADVITRVRPDGSSKYISPAIKTLLGWTREEMSGDPL